MSLNTKTKHTIITAAREFAAGIAESTEYKEYEEAADAFRKDSDARKLLQRFQTAQQKAQRFAAWGGTAKGSDEDDPVKLQAEVMANPVLTRYFSSQEELVRLLKNTNEYMTEKLGFDLADITKPAGGCC